MQYIFPKQYIQTQKTFLIPPKEEEQDSFPG